MSLHYLVGVEIGGTFTDLILMRDGEIVETLKVPSTPANPAEGALKGLRQLSIPLSEMAAVVHGSTVATNAILERKGARTGLLTTAGFRDILEIQREERDRIYDLRYRKPKPLVSRDRVLPVPERIDGSGTVVRPLDPALVEAAIDELVRQRGVTSIAICLLNSYLNPLHEQRLAAMIRERYCEVYLSTSSDVLPEFREYDRASTTVINAFVTPKVDRYIGSMEARMGDEGLRGEFIIMQSNGGVLPADAARKHGAWVLLSGPAAGAVAAGLSGSLAGYPKIISLDMGGTSADVCLTEDGVLATTTETEIDGLPLRLPMVDIVSIGAGGGSIAQMDEGGMLRVGPQSAGADPGPACYGRNGEQPTVTDANVLRGLIRPQSFLGGRMPLLPERSRFVYAPLAAQLGVTVEEAAEAVCRVVNANMAQAVRLVSVARGHDPRDFMLVAFGGAGPLHAVALAEDLEAKGVLVPRYPGLLSAYGLLVADFRRDYVQTRVTRIGATTPAAILAEFDQLEARGRAEFAMYRSMPSVAVMGTFLDMRYRGQAYELRVPVSRAELEPADDLGWLAEHFHAVHLQRYGHASPRDEVEIVSARLSLGATRMRLSSDGRDKAGEGTMAGCKDEPDGEGRVYLGGAWVPASYWRRGRLVRGQRAAGPCVIEEPTATTFVPTGWAAEVDGLQNLLLTRGRNQGRTG